MSCGDKISSCRRHVQVEYLHPRVKNVHLQFKQPWLDPIFLSLFSSPCGDKISSCLFSNQQVENLLPQFKQPWLVPILLSPTSSSCGDKISSCLLSNQQVENLLPQFTNLHPHGKTCSHNSNGPSPHLFVATRFHLVSCRISKLKTCAHGLKTCTHNSKNPGSFPPSSPVLFPLWRQDFILSLVESAS